MKLSDRAPFSNRSSRGRWATNGHARSCQWHYSGSTRGRGIWQLLGEGRTLAEICDVMMDEYEVARDEIERDVLSLVGNCCPRPDRSSLASTQPTADRASGNDKSVTQRPCCW